MNNEGYYITVKGVKNIITNDYIDLSNIFNITDFCLIKLVLNDNLKILNCSRNQIEELELNDNLQQLYCDINTKLLNINNNCYIQIYEK